jgi:hypothetical protein
MKDKELYVDLNVAIRGLKVKHAILDLTRLIISYIDIWKLPP